MTYAVNWGLVLAHDTKGTQARRFERMLASAYGQKRPVGLSGAALEKAIYALAARRPDLVRVVHQGS
jgi:hypothetical protein